MPHTSQQPTLYVRLPAQPLAPWINVAWNASLHLYSIRMPLLSLRAGRAVYRTAARVGCYGDLEDA